MQVIALIKSDTSWFLILSTGKRCWWGRRLACPASSAAGCAAAVWLRELLYKNT